jgi:hypothetical protein
LLKLLPSNGLWLWAKPYPIYLFLMVSFYFYKCLVGLLVVVGGVLPHNQNLLRMGYRGFSKKQKQGLAEWFKW